jgi:hypothetical protein
MVLYSKALLLYGVHNGFNGKNCSGKAEDCFYQQFGITFKEALVKCYTAYGAAIWIFGK